jgi:hypothetical protein
VAADIEHGRLEQVFDRGGADVDDLVSERNLPGMFDRSDEIVQGAAVASPIAVRFMLQVGEQQRTATLR